MLTTCRMRSTLDSGAKPPNEAERLIRELERHVETGFQLATVQGPLCGEAVEGLAYFLESLEVDETGIEEEQRACFCRVFSMQLTLHVTFRTQSGGASDGLAHFRCA